MQIVKSGMISIVGRPNAGKSTLLNRLAGEKVAIVSDKPQTTRNRICAVVDREDCQYVFMDTPGFHKPRSRLGEYMVQVVRESVTDVDAVLMVVEPVARIGKPEQALLDRLEGCPVPVLLLINKIDTVEKETLLSVMALYARAYPFQAVLPVSALEGEGLDALFSELAPHMPEGPRLFPEGMVTDQPERQILAELIREKMLRLLDREVPHGTAVEIERMEQRGDGVVAVSAVIYCEKDSHKGIIIGKGGAMLKKIGALAREDMEAFLGTKVFLETWVKVKENWRDRPGSLRSFGFEL